MLNLLHWALTDSEAVLEMLMGVHVTGQRIFPGQLLLYEQHRFTSDR